MLIESVRGQSSIQCLHIPVEDKVLVPSGFQIDKSVAATRGYALLTLGTEPTITCKLVIMKTL